MYSDDSQRDLLADPKISALLATIESSTELVETKKEKPKLKHPPVSFEGFLEEEQQEWPQRLTSESTLDLSEIDASMWTEERLLKVLKKMAPLNLDQLIDVESSINEFDEKLTAFAGYIVCNEELPSRFKENLFHAPSKEFLDDVASSDALMLHHSKKKKAADAKQTMAEQMQALRSQNVEYASFPGFRDGELTELPSQLEAPQLLNKVSLAQNFTKGFNLFWKKIFFSEASIALLQDSFWWFFLENFENNTTAQDKLFTRIASSYVCLFVSVHPDMRDKFFKNDFTICLELAAKFLRVMAKLHMMSKANRPTIHWKLEYPRCFAQSVYVTYREAFPESRDRLAEQFVNDIYLTVSEWVTGVRPPVDEWKRWPWESLCPAPNEEKTPTLSRRESIKSQGRRAAEYIRDLQTDLSAALLPQTADSFATNEMAKEPALFSNAEFEKTTPFADSEKSPRIGKASTFVTSKTTHTATPGSMTAKGLSKTSYLTAESAQSGPGPEFERVMFNLSGKSPLVAHYLYMRQLRDKTMKGKKMKRTEIVQYPPPAPTFQEIIHDSKKTVRNLQSQRDRMMAITEEERIRQELLRKQIAVETKRLKEELNDPVEIKMKCDRVLDLALGGGMHRPASYATTRPTTADLDHLLQEDPDCLPDPDSVI